MIITKYSKEVLNIYTQMLSQYLTLENRIKELKNQIKVLPSDNFFCTQNGKHYKWYRSKDHTNCYIPKKERHLAEQLAYKKYLCLLLDDLQHEQRAIQFYLKHHANESKSELLLNHPEYQRLLSSSFTPLSQELSEWMNSSYKRNLSHPEGLIYKSSSGHLVRSKSESIIDMLLNTNRIPFRYESALELGDITVFPDFTIRHPQTGAIYYWEHFGLMDNPSYSQKAYQKMQLYTTHNIIPSVQLITTFESSQNPLSPDIVEKIIKHYFL